MLDEETGELVERRLEHENGEARAFYAAPKGGGPSYREAKGGECYCDGECYRRNVQPSQRHHRTRAYSPFMPWGLKRYQQTRQLHFVTFSCYHRNPLLANSQACDIFVRTLETVRRWYGFWLIGYVVMPEHVHLLLSEPESKNLALALQMLKQMVSRNLRPVGGPS